MSTPENWTPGSSAVRYFVPGSKLPRGWRGKMEVRRDELRGFVADGHASDFADYRYRVGVINGMSEAICMLEDMEKDEER